MLAMKYESMCVLTSATTNMACWRRCQCVKETIGVNRTRTGQTLGKVKGSRRQAGNKAHVVIVSVEIWSQSPLLFHMIG